MTQIRIRETGAVMYEGEFRALHPNTSFPPQIDEATLNAFGADVVFEGAQAQPTRYQIAFRDGVTQDDQGRWFTKYSVADMNDEAKAALDAQQAASQRTSRDEKLKASDWTQVADSPVDKDLWATYRQNLRDVPSQTGFPWDITWPINP
jgi:hypothetical protein